MIVIVVTKKPKTKTTSALLAGNRGAQVLQLPFSLVDATWLFGFETTPEKGDFDAFFCFCVGFVGTPEEKDVLNV